MLTNNEKQYCFFEKMISFNVNVRDSIIKNYILNTTQSKITKNAIICMFVHYIFRYT